MSKILMRSCGGALGALGMLYLAGRIAETISDKTICALRDHMELMVRRARTEGMAVEAQSRLEEPGGTVTYLRRER